MGHQLWTSPATGYRRHGTRLKDFNAVLGDRLLVTDICEPLRCCPLGASAVQMAAELKFLDFDIAGVRESENAPVLGLVDRTSLVYGAVGDHLKQIEVETIVDSTMTIRALLVALKALPFVFLRTEGDINAIVTRADLNKPMVRVYLFGLISLLEIHLGFWISHAYDPLTWQSKLSKRRLDAASLIQQQRANEGQELELMQCLQLCDKRTLIVGHTSQRHELGLGSKRSSNNFLSDVERLRNSLAHSQYDLTTGGRWADLIALTERIQGTVELSDRLVESRALKHAADYVGALW